MPTNFRGLQERLRERLLAHINAGELTGIQLARQTGFRQAHISNFLNRKRGLSLEAMDAILRTTRISLTELIDHRERKRPRHQKTGDDCARYLSIPVVGEPDLTATQVPNAGTRETLKVALTTIQKLQPDMYIPRPHWDRFVALRVKTSDAEAMAPRLSPGAVVVVVDRHYNALTPWKNQRNMYLVRANGFHIRYVERVGDELILRPHNPAEMLMRVTPEPGHDAMSAIIGRVCLIQLQL